MSDSSDSSDTQPGWKPRRGPSDRLLIAILGLLMAMVEGWHAISPAQAATADQQTVTDIAVLKTQMTEVIRRIDGIESKAKR